jgi:hypothetical protein
MLTFPKDSTLERDEQHNEVALPSVEMVEPLSVVLSILWQPINVFGDSDDKLLRSTETHGVPRYQVVNRVRRFGAGQ